MIKGRSGQRWRESYGDEAHQLKRDVLQDALCLLLRYNLKVNEGIKEE